MITALCITVTYFLIGIICRRLYRNLFRLSTMTVLDEIGAAIWLLMWPAIGLISMWLDCEKSVKIIKWYVFDNFYASETEIIEFYREINK